MMPLASSFSVMMISATAELVSTRTFVTKDDNTISLRTLSQIS